MKTFTEFLREDQETTVEQAGSAPVTVSRTEPPSMTTARTADAPKDATVKMKKFSEFAKSQSGDAA